MSNWARLCTVTSLARTLLDLAAVVRRRVLERSRGHRGRRALVAAIAAAAHTVPWVRSELERRFLKLCRASGLPEPAVNVWVEGHEVDAAWLEHKLVVELDSHQHHRTAAAFERDRKRDTKLQIAGYRVIRVTQQRIEHDTAELVAELRTLLGLDSGL